jgi:hypothetical protein
MSHRKHIDTYLEGWRRGDAALSLSATAAGFYYDDPNTGRIQRTDFVAFFEDFKAAAADLGDGEAPDPFLEYTDVVIDDALLPATVWCWWRARGTDLQGAALIKADASGVMSEHLTYFSKLPD